MPALSVIIPTLNEASELPETLKRARAIPEVKEIIVVDAGSTDDTKAIAREHNCIVIESEPSRGKQLRLGAQRASGAVILFLLKQCGGAPDVPRMEEFELCKFLAAHGRLALAPATVLTSALKFRKYGTLKTHWLMTRCLGRYWLGASPQRLAEIYYGKNTDAHDVQDEKLLS